MLSKKLIFRTEYCALAGEVPDKVDHKYINLYIQTTGHCNADCRFCTFCSKKMLTPYFKKFGNILLSFRKEGIRVNKIAFTGGEPSIALPALTTYLRIIEHVLDYKPFIVVNSNGYNLRWLHDEKSIDNISLSYHSTDEGNRFYLARTDTIARDAEIKKYSSKIHLTCNLIKGFVDSEHKIINYLEKAASLNVFDVGFVSLMRVNDFCKHNHVDFSNITFKSDSIVCNKIWTLNDICKCNNYLYLPKKGKKVVKFYMRYRCKNNSDSPSNYVYDGRYLKTNFDGEIIL